MKKAQQNNAIIKSLLDYNKEQSRKFIEPGQTLLRRQYRAQNRVEIAAMKCMDGRINLSVMTATPLGIIRPFRNLGGKFDIGSYFGEVLAEWLSLAVNAGKDAIILVTYHWSRSSPGLGCKGFHCDVHAAQEYTASALHDIEEVFGKEHTVVYPIQVGIETDEDALVFHGIRGKKLDLSTVGIADREMLRVVLEGLYPDMGRMMIESLIDLCVGNIEHIAKMRKAMRPPADINHKENILGLGRGFDWYHQPNRMLIVGPYSYDLAEPIAVAARILLDNIQSGRIPKKDGIALVTSGTYRDEAGPEKRRAAMKAQSLLRFALATLKRDVPDIMKYLSTGAGILNENTRLFTPVDIKK